MSVVNHKLPVQTGATGQQLAEAMMGAGVTVVSATYQGDALSEGIYSQGFTYSPGVVPSDSGIILSTGHAADFTNQTGANNQTANRSSDTTGVNDDVQMNTIAGVHTYDGAFLSTTFTSTGGELTMQLVFSSEEYLEWVNTGFNDAVGIWVNGVQAKLALGAGDISIDNINTTSNPNLFLNNTAGTYNTEMDGATVVLTLKAAVSTTSVNTLSIKIADAGDSIYDSNLLVVADSVQSALIAHDDIVVLTSKGHASYDLLANDITAGRGGVHVTQINGHAMTVGSTVTLGTGETLTLNSDGTIGVDAIASSNHVTFTYQIADSHGVTDTAYITLATDPVDGTEGDDQMDTHYVDAQGNQIDGTDGAAEVIFGYGGNDKITAGLGDDDVYGGNGNDFIRAGDGNDLIVGGDGNDVLDGGKGDDRMDGGNGDDVFYIDSIKDVVIEAANSGYDKVISTLNHTLGTNFEELWLKEGSLAQEGIGNALANKIVGNSVDNLIKGFGGFDQLWGNEGADSIYGGLGNDLIFGGSGADSLFGDEGADKLFGGDGADKLYGGAGSDTLDAGNDGGTLSGDAGNDLLVGGTGYDHFVFATGSGTDRIKGFDLGNDQIVIDGVDAGSVKITHHGSNLWVQWGTADKIILTHIDPHAVVTAETLGIGMGFDHFA